jgi:hypothetical protein
MFSVCPFRYSTAFPLYCGPSLFAPIKTFLLSYTLYAASHVLNESKRLSQPEGGSPSFPFLLPRCHLISLEFDKRLLHHAIKVYPSLVLPESGSQMAKLRQRNPNDLHFCHLSQVQHCLRSTLSLPKELASARSYASNIRYLASH